jgi:glycosyltransferase involved in cell wall biosynthesis
MKILFLTPQLPFPPESGGTIKSFYLISYLAKKYKLTVATLIKSGNSSHVREFEQNILLDDFLATSIDIPRTGVNFLISIWKNKPLNVYRNYSDVFSKKLLKIIDKYDIVLVDHDVMFQYLPATYQGKIILHQHNAEYLIWERYAEIEQNKIKKMLLNFEAQRLKAYEKDICERSDAILASPNDIELLSKFKIDRNKFYITYHLGNENYHDLPALEYAATENSLMYIGTLSWEANIQGLVWFINSGWNKIKEKIPDLRLYIIGKNPDARIINAAKLKDGIILTGFVEDLELYFKKSKIFIAPLQFGSGMKVKVLSAMDRGIPTVTTSVGAEGIDAVDMLHLAISDNIDEMIDKILILINDENIWQKLSRNSRELIHKMYTWEIVYKHLEKSIENVIQK